MSKVVKSFTNESEGMTSSIFQTTDQFGKVLDFTVTLRDDDSGLSVPTCWKYHGEDFDMAVHKAMVLVGQRPSGETVSVEV